MLDLCQYMDEKCTAYLMFFFSIFFSMRSVFFLGWLSTWFVMFPLIPSFGSCFSGYFDLHVSFMSSHSFLFCS